MKHLLAFVLLAVTFTGLCVWQGRPPQVAGGPARSQFYAPREAAWKLHQLSVAGVRTNPEVTIKALQERLSPVYEKRFGQYQANLTVLYQNLRYQVIFVAAALVVLFRKVETFKVPVIDVEVPVRWVGLALPPCLIYLWLRFGYTLNELIDARIVLWKIAEAMQAPVSAFAEPGLDATNAWRQALYTFSHLPAAYDGGFMDGWFITFESNYTLQGKPQTGASLLMVLFGVFFGLGSGTTLALILHSKQRYADSPAQRRLFTAYFWVAAALLGFSHWSFWHDGDHPNWQQPIVVAVTCAVALGLLRLTRTEASAGTAVGP